MVDSEMRKDCAVWLDFLANPTAVCRPFIDFENTLQADVIDFYTDASGLENLGMGCVFGDRWMVGVWDKQFMRANKPSTEFLELLTFTAAISKWACLLEGRRVVVFCDNMSVVEMVNHSTSSCSHCMNLVRLITLISLENHVRFFA